ncbi:HAMP domain-containing protein [Synergistaceae bacterium OttesenSCG-928-D05]|nr:HAMP domain-containing protein [Synergistaceae bacterium OttesenSCG-928-D05]
MYGELTLRKKIITLLTVTVIAVALLTWFLIYRSESQLLIASNDQMLSHYLDAFQSAGKSEGVDGIRTLSKLWMDVYPYGRLTLIDADGRVLIDSSENPDIMDNHYRRPEIVAAMSQGEGADLRFSATMGQWLNYIARSIEVHGSASDEHYILRLGYPVDKLSGLVKSVGKRFAITLVLALLLLWSVCYWMLRMALRPLSELNKTAEAIADGRPARFPVTNSSELRKLSDVLNTMYDALQKNLQYEEEGRESLEIVFETLPLGVIILDADKKITFINKTAVYLCGLDEQDRPAPGTSIEIVLPSVEMCQMVYEADSKRLLRTAYNGGMHLEISTATLANEQMIVIQDHTEKIHLDEARRDFFIDAGHEFQTPLAVIRMGLDLLKSGSSLKNQEDRDMINRLITQQERVSKLVEDLLFLVRLDSGPLRIQYEKIDAFAITKELIADMKEVSYARDVDISYEVPGEGEAYIFGRAEDIRRAVFNLLENACKYVSAFRSEGGKVKMTITDSPERWVINVDDNGPGIPRAEREFIFHRFRRGESHRARRGIAPGGYGLGLSISRRIAERHGGKLELLEDAEFGGCSFRMALPKRMPDAS